MPDSPEAILARLDERTKDLPERLDDMRELASELRERVATNEEAIRGIKRLSVMISTAVSGAINGAAQWLGGGS